MNRTVRSVVGASVVGSVMSLLAPAVMAVDHGVTVKDEPRPSNIRLQETDLGIVFADSRGRTIYFDRNDTKPNTPTCAEKDPADMRLTPGQIGGQPPLAQPMTCLTKHIPVEVGDAKPVGPWTILERENGIRQWAYNGKAVYTSVKDLEPGHVRLAIDMNLRQISKRFLPLYAPLDLPPEITVQPIGFVAKVFGTHTGRTLYTLTNDPVGKSVCEGKCLEKWRPLLGATLSQPRGPWTLITRKDGSRQWAMKGKPLYTFADDRNQGDTRGNNLPGVEVAVAYMAARAPVDAFDIHPTPLGDIYTTKEGKTVYAYMCPGRGFGGGAECDDPGDKNHWWFVDCGATAERCAQTWIPVRAAANAKPTKDGAWSVVTMPLPWSPVRAADDGKEAGLKVWAYQGRPLFTYVHEDLPGMIDGLDIGTLGGPRWFGIFPKGIDLNAKKAVAQAAR